VSVTRFDHLKGVFGLLPTPYREDYEISTKELAALAEFCCSSGQHGIVWPVMVGEFYFLGEQERAQHLTTVLEAVNGRVPVVFGCSSNSLPETLRYAAAAQRAGADAIIAMAPPDATPGMATEMFCRLADSFEGPLIVQNTAERVSLTSEDLSELVEKVPRVEYVKEERPPGPHHISEVHEVLGDRVKTIFGGLGGRLLPEELSRGAGGCMPACQFADVLARVMELWWAGDQTAARALHGRLLPLIIRETHPFMRYVLRQRGVITSTTQRGPARWPGLDEGDTREISVLVEEIQQELRGFPFRDGPPSAPG
jgi:dihydrodipicolinate synthase/N-acetylneuraminate lyase